MGRKSNPDIFRGAPNIGEMQRFYAKKKAMEREANRRKNDESLTLKDILLVLVIIYIFLMWVIL